MGKKDNELERTLKDVLKDIPQDYRDRSFSHIAIVANALKRDRPEHVLKRLDEYYDNLSEAVSEIVDVNFQSFNASIKNFSDILSNLNQSQQKIEGLEADINSCKELLTSRANDLKQLYENYLQHTEFLNILKQVEEVKAVPDQLRKSIQTKHYLHAVRLILTSTEKLQTKQLKSIKALSGIRTTLTEARAKLPEILVDELNRHIYNGVDVSKATISDILSAFTKQGKKETKNEDEPPNTARRLSRMGRRMSRFSPLRQSHESSFANGRENSPIPNSFDEDDESDTVMLLHDDLTLDPEFDSHYFMMLIIETLDKLGKLQDVQNQLAERLRYELRSLIASHISSFANGLESTDTVLWTIIQNKKMAASQQASTTSSFDSDDNIVKKALLQGTLLTNCLRTLFDKMRGVLSNFQFVVDVIEFKFKQSGVKPKTPKGNDVEALTGENVWITIQNELKTLLKDLLGVTAEELEYYETGVPVKQEMSSPTPVATPVKDQTPSKKKKKQEPSKVRFRFGTNIESVVPELVSPTANQSTADKIAFGTSDQKTGYSSSTLPLLNYFFFTPYNMIWMYRLVREFIDEGTQVVNKSALKGTDEKVSKDTIFDSRKDQEEEEEDIMKVFSHLAILQEFMDDVIRHSLISRVRKDYRAKITEMLKDNEAFKPRESLYTKTSISYSPDSKYRPLLISAVSLSQWIDELYQFANAIPPNRSEFFSIMDILLKRYLEDCKLKFREKITGKYIWDCMLNRTDLVSILESDPEWRHLYKVVTAIASLTPASPTDEVKDTSFPSLVTVSDTAEAESVDLFKIDANLIQYTNLERSLIIDRASSTILLCNLNDSLEWLAEQISEISKQGFNTFGKMAMDMMLPSMDFGSSSLESGIAQSSENVSRTLREYYRKYKLLANQCLFALKIDIRAHCYFYLSDIQYSIYECEEEASEPENFVTQFNTDLQQQQRIIVTYLPHAKRTYLFQGIAPLVARILTSSLPKIKHRKFNKNGVVKMRRNIFALQQNITSIVNATKFTEDTGIRMGDLFTIDTTLEKEVHFNRVRLYYSLLTLSIKELFAHLRSDDVLLYLYNDYGEMYPGVSVYSLEEYMAILETKLVSESEEDQKKNRLIMQQLYEQMVHEVTQMVNDDVQVL